MIHQFLKYLSQQNIDYVLLNGYDKLDEVYSSNSDVDMLFKKNNFNNIEKIIASFCKETNYKIVQIYHQEVWAKNIFLYNEVNQCFLNLDLYGELSRAKTFYFKENEVFQKLNEYNNLPILAHYQEFIYYFIKRLTKKKLSIANFYHLRKLYLKDTKRCQLVIQKFFPNKNTLVFDILKNNTYDALILVSDLLINDILENKGISFSSFFLNVLRILKRINKPTGISISFLGPDGAGKSTIINNLKQTPLPFRRHDYFHLKPINKTDETTQTVSQPHKFEPYSSLKSYMKLLYFIKQYNFGWVKNIITLKIKSSLVIFDRFYDDLLVDNKRYRYGGRIKVAKLVRIIIPKPELYFVLTANASVIHQRKKEVPYSELKRQINAYQSLVDNKRYFHINVDRKPNVITTEIIHLLMNKMHERY